MARCGPGFGSEGEIVGALQSVEAQLSGPGGIFEVTLEDVGGVPTKVYANRMGSLAELIEGARNRTGDTFIVHGERTITYPEFVAMAERGAAALATGPAGITKGDRVAVLAANCPEWCMAFWSTVAMGGVLVGLNGWWKADEILYGLADSSARALVADRGRYERVAGSLGDLPELRVVYLIGADVADLPAPGGSVELRSADELFGDQASASAADAPAPASALGERAPVELGEDDPAVIFYTSGTTGRPKGAVSTHRGMVANLQDTFYIAVAGTMAAAIDGTGGSVLPTDGGQTVGLLTSPLFHVSGCHSNLVVSFAAGSKIVIPPGRFDPEVIMATIEREKVAIWSAVPTMIWRVVDDPRRHEFDLSSVRSIAYGGSPSAGELQRLVRQTFPNVQSIGNAYGLTETSSVATINIGLDAVERPESVGRAMPVVSVKIVHPATATAEIADVDALPTGEVGEICVSGPILMAGYWGKPVETAAVMARGWLRTGDLGRVDEEGFVYVTDRAKDMIIRGGENVYCAEIENRLVEHPAVAEAAVVGVPHHSLGEEVRAIVRLEPGMTVGTDELKAWVAETLADFKVPAHVEVVDEDLPRNASGKLLKNLLRGGGEPTLAETF
jgi:long-chain acyl-CoA synthetase